MKFICCGLKQRFEQLLFVFDFDRLPVALLINLNTTKNVTSQFELAIVNQLRLVFVVGIAEIINQSLIIGV